MKARKFELSKIPSQVLKPTATHQFEGSSERHISCDTPFVLAFIVHPALRMNSPAADIVVAPAIAATIRAAIDTAAVIHIIINDIIIISILRRIYEDHQTFPLIFIVYLSCTRSIIYEIVANDRVATLAVAIVIMVAVAIDVVAPPAATIVTILATINIIINIFLLILSLLFFAPILRRPHEYKSCI